MVWNTFPFSHIKNRVSISGTWVDSCADSCKTWITPQYTTMLQFSYIFIQLFCVRKCFYFLATEECCTRTKRSLFVQVCFWSWSLKITCKEQHFGIPKENDVLYNWFWAHLRAEFYLQAYPWRFFVQDCSLEKKIFLSKFSNLVQFTYIQIRLYIYEPV